MNSSPKSLPNKKNPIPRFIEKLGNEPVLVAIESVLIANEKTRHSLGLPKWLPIRSIQFFINQSVETLIKERIRGVELKVGMKPEEVFIQVKEKIIKDLQRLGLDEKTTLTEYSNCYNQEKAMALLKGLNPDSKNQPTTKFN